MMTASEIFSPSERRKGINPAAMAFSKPINVESHAIPRIKIIAVPAKEKATGKPANKTKHTTANIRKGINSTIIEQLNSFDYF